MKILHFLLCEFHDAVDRCKQCVVFSFSDVQSWVDFGSALSSDDLAGFDNFSVVNLHAKTLRLRITPKLGRPTRFLMCHRRLLVRNITDGSVEVSAKSVKNSGSKLIRRGRSCACPRMVSVSL